MELKDIRCPCCGQVGHLGIYRTLTEAPSEKSSTGYFLIPIEDPIIICNCCGNKYKSIEIEGGQIRYFPI